MKKWIQWSKLFGGLIIIWAIVTQFHSLIPGKFGQQFFEETQEKELDAGALFYTESEEGMKVYYRWVEERVVQKSRSAFLHNQ